LSGDHKLPAAERVLTERRFRKFKLGWRKDVDLRLRRLSGGDIEITDPFRP
jgi:hypothetical protein